MSDNNQRETHVLRRIFKWRKYKRAKFILPVGSDKYKDSRKVELKDV